MTPPIPRDAAPHQTSPHALSPGDTVPHYCAMLPPSLVSRLLRSLFTPPLTPSRSFTSRRRGQPRA
eukprot:6832836-Prymnesium_polylepis.1